MYIKRKLKICDLYGSKFHWYIGYKPKYYSYYGGIFSLLCLATWIIIFIVFGLEDFHRTPIINTSSFPPNGYKNIQFGKQKLYLPWRIVDYYEKPLNHKGILYPKIYYFTNKYNNETGVMKSNYTLLNYKLCNETSMKDLGKEFLLDIAIEDLYCIDMEDLKIGGSWNAEFINYVRFDIHLCKDGIDYNETNINCTSFKEFEDLHGEDNSWFFELLYPVVQFQPIDQNIPVLILYKTYYYIFSRYSNKLDRIYLQEHILQDEKGWIFNKPHNISYWGANSFNGDNYYRGEKDILHKGSTSRLYSLKIYLNLGITYYTRRYKKIYEILSEVFPIIRAITSFFGFLSDSMNELNSTKKLNEFIIGIDKRKKKIKNKSSIQILNDIKMIEYSSKINNNSFINNFKGANIKTEDINNKINFEDSSKLNCMPIMNKKELVITTKKSNKSLGLNIKKNKNKNISNTFSFNKNKIKNCDSYEKIEFPLSYYLLGYLLIKIKSRKFKNSCISKKFNKSFTFYSHIIDVSSYVTLYQQFELFKKIVEKRLQLIEEDSNKKDNLYLRNNRVSNYERSLPNNIILKKRMKSITLINKK